MIDKSANSTTIEEQACNLNRTEVNQSMFISQATTQRIFQARMAFEQSQSYGVYDGAWLLLHKVGRTWEESHLERTH